MAFRVETCSTFLKKKFALERTIKAHSGVEIEIHSFFNFGVRWCWMVSATPLPLYPQKEIRYPFYRRLCVFQGLSAGCIGKYAFYGKIKLF
jgi:hypothetical protein